MNLLKLLVQHLWLPFLLFSPSTVSQKIDKYFDASGGVSLWRSLENIVVEAETKHYEKNYGAGDSVSVKTVQSREIITREGLFRGEYKSDGQMHKTIFDGSNLKDIGPTGFVYEHSDAVLDQYFGRVFHLGETWIAIKSNIVKFVDIVIEGNNLYEVYDIEFRKMERKYYISKTTGLLYKVSMFGGRTMTVFGDYRNVAGYVIPFRKTGYINGRIELVKVIRRVQINQALDSSIFSQR